MSEEVETEAENEEGQEEEASSGGRKKLFIIIGAALFLVLAGGGAAYFFLFSGGGSEEETVAEVPPSYFYDIPPMTVNLANSGDDNEQFLKLTVSLELKDEATVAIIEPRMALVRDAFQVYLRELRRSDLEGSAGIFRLKEELRRRVNLAIRPAEIQSILFKEILVQ